MDREALDRRLREILDGVRERIMDEASPALENFADVENAICDELNRSKADALQAWCDEAKEASGPPRCPHCGGRMRNKGRAGKEVIAEGGPVKLTRTRYWCDACKASFSPSGQHGDGGGPSADAAGGEVGD